MVAGTALALRLLNELRRRGAHVAIPVGQRPERGASATLKALNGTPPLVLTFEAEKTVSPERVMQSAILERYARPGPEAVARHVATSDPAARRQR